MIQTRDSHADLWDAFQQGITRGLENSSLLSCSRWAEHRRVMGAPFPGPYSFLHHPWCREIHNSKAAFTVAMKAAQLGITEAGINRAFFTLDQLKRDVLYVLPTTLERERLFQGSLRHRTEAQPLPQVTVRRHQHGRPEIDRHQRPVHPREPWRFQPEVHPGLRTGPGRVGRDGHEGHLVGLGTSVRPDREARRRHFDADRAQVRHP